jgi:hypothetical protein
MEQSTSTAMKWFTRDWAWGDAEDDVADAVRADYWRHVERIEPQLHSGAEVLVWTDIHDGRMTAWQSTSSTLSFTLHIGDRKNGGFEFLSLTFANANLIGPVSLDELEYAATKAEFTYDEVDVIDDSTFEYRVLMWPKGELVLRFGSVGVEHVAAPI